jgi:hypothetical protein
VPEKEPDGQEKGFVQREAGDDRPNEAAARRQPPHREDREWRESEKKDRGCDDQGGSRVAQFS